MMLPHLELICLCRLVKVKVAFCLLWWRQNYLTTINIAASYRYSLVLSFFACDRRSFTNTIKSKSPPCLYWHDSVSKYWVFSQCFDISCSFVVITGAVDVLVTLLAKQGAVVTGLKSAMEIIGADRSLLYLAVYLHGASQLTPDYLEYPLSVQSIQKIKSLVEP